MTPHDPSVKRTLLLCLTAACFTFGVLFGFTLALVVGG